MSLQAERNAVRVPPHDLDAERAVIGGMLVSALVVGIATETLSEVDFYSETHRQIFAACSRLATGGQPVDQLTVAAELRDVGEFDRVGGRQYVFQLVEAVPTAANARQYAETVRGKSMLRAVIDATARVQEDAYADTDTAAEVIDAAEQAIFRISHLGKREGSSGSLADIAPGVLERIQDLYDAGAEVTGIPSGFSDLDAMTSGYHRGDLVILAARPAMGKTAMSLDLAKHAAVKSTGVAYFSLEMSKEQLTQRLLSGETRIPLQSIRSGRVPASDWPRLVRGTASIATLPIEIDDTAGMTVGGMRSRLRRIAAKFRQRDTPLGLVVVDYLQLMGSGPGSSNRNRENEVSEMSRGLKVLARDLDVPVIALSQLSRACEQRLNKRPLLSDLRESGGIEQDADMVKFLYRDEYYDPDTDDQGIAEVIVGKHRNGPTGTVKLAWLAQETRFASLSKEVVG